MDLGRDPLGYFKVFGEYGWELGKSSSLLLDCLYNFIAFFANQEWGNGKSGKNFKICNWKFVWFLSVFKVTRIVVWRWKKNDVKCFVALLMMRDKDRATNNSLLNGFHMDLEPNFICRPNWEDGLYLYPYEGPIITLKCIIKSRRWINQCCLFINVRRCKVFLEHLKFKCWYIYISCARYINR